MQTPLSNALRLVAGAACIVSTLLPVCALTRAVQVDGSGTSTGNGVLVPIGLDVIQQPAGLRGRGVGGWTCRWSSYCCKRAPIPTPSTPII
jgi:hypothetical protein